MKAHSSTLCRMPGGSCRPPNYANASRRRKASAPRRRALKSSKGLKRQNLLTADGKFVIPTSGGLQIFELLRQAAPGLVDPATTAVWEMQLDDIVAGRGDFRAVIDGIAETAGRLIEILQGQSYSTVDLGIAKPATGRAERRTAGKARSRQADRPKSPPVNSASEGGDHRSRSGQRRRRLMRPRLAKTHSGRAAVHRPRRWSPTRSGWPGIRMFLLPSRLEQDFEICRRFLDQYSR